MRREGAPFQAQPEADIDWSGALPSARRFDDVYFSRSDGLDESTYTFLQGNDLPARFTRHSARSFRVAETGFGTGLNFLLTWEAWRSCGPRRPDLHYLSLEKYPLAPADLERALQAFPRLAPLARALQQAYPPPLPGRHRLHLEGGRVCLDLCWGEASDTLADLASRQRRWVDAWYLDGFAPAKNAALWSAQLLALLAPLSRPGATLATFTAAGAVRRTLDAAGFAMRKVPGHGAKREALRGVLRAPVAAPPAAAETPWDLPARQAATPSRVLVLGAGLAGCAAAASLARRGIATTVLDAGAVACGASGNAQGILYTRLSRQHSALGDFALHSFSHALRHYRDLFDSAALRRGRDGDLCGCFAVQRDAAEREALRALLPPLAQLAQVVDAATASQLLGVEQAEAGYWYPGSGWLHPPAVCTALLQHDMIDLMQDCGPISLRQRGDTWQACGARGVLAEAPCAIIAAGGDSGRLAGLDWLPLRRVRGQTTTLPGGPPLDALRAAFCHDGYIAPAGADGHCIGATFTVGDDGDEVRAQDNRHNLQRLASAVPAWRAHLDSLDADTLPARVGQRCASPDYLPLVGPVPDVQAFCADYAGLRRNAKRPIERRGRYLQGLYLSTGHGSRGLTSTPLAAELLTAMICDEPPPLERELCRALAPARFLLRDLARGRR
ncbi:MAG: bifunctional tRNA (5-methylaminomethyl-2-thiouridine)(34)-methyltransferase MnmD/FAD-dependent 5-carboxymethylaminomethyl-2-thiouridine(34) oxidoreductase MnmC [Halioglobus sp.]|nr:bifunctional tRNA (5-methylaminomethyl-2-thiouridine)(34)-methyltransferase MnmD/FAD-dependent 5-carboxymethylaminomethyl-2-thiouridine(34) oxidoreductase MnmC [Halioglobus sp.]